ncbi:cohesin domain-containing protein [Methanolobus mangrovi]|uniref:Cohesin domain-containing protein n=1 Tax=Methanolobus mangrovi TaxID=3072977 RepID=A0AA51UE22_9EURY|nr:cohesin domain-containing protein [Methanolobus mangrovi]WMW21460.1 cohesin domain-containing protein [Methanolobus mangrovi]
MKWILFSLLLFCFISSASGAELTVSIDDMQAASGSSIELPIVLRDAEDVGSMDLVLKYDAEVLQATSVKTSDIGKNAFIESNTANEGEVIIALADASGISGDGPVVKISFMVVGDAGSSCAVTLEEAKIHNTELVELVTGTEDGTVTVTEASGKNAGYASVALYVVAIFGLCAMIINRNE